MQERTAIILNRGSEHLKPVPLAQIAPGGSYFVESVSAPEPQRLRLCEMGFIAGAPVSVIACSREGMLVVKVGGSRMALSRGTTEQIWVQPKAPSA